jgi:prepilin signal peptidase PulO-like enzyme (type II secretory pathway)
MRRFLRSISVFVWVVVTLSWPLTKWLLALDVLFQIIRAAIEQSLLGIARVALHFAVFAALSWYVTYYRPVGRERGIS